MVYRIALVRHGQSEFNLNKKFTGWTDVDLTETGKKEAIQAGELLRTEEWQFDLAFCSVLKRSIKTLQYILEELDQLWIPVEKSWRLNERHYGDLQEVSKTETAKKHGEKQLQDWRRGYDSAPAPLENGHNDARHPCNDRRYHTVDEGDLPMTESLKQTIERVLPYWQDSVLPAVKAGKRCIIVGHGNSIRALVKIIDDISNEEIRTLEIPTGVPLIYELSNDLKPVRHYHVGTSEAFTRRLGVLGVNQQADRILKAVVSRFSFMIVRLCSTSEAFTRRLGILGVNEQAERILKAVVSRFSFMIVRMCSTSEAFTRRLGVLGVNEQAERMLKAFVSRGLELRLDDIKYHAQGKDNEIESLTGISSANTDNEVIKRSDVLFLFGDDVQEIKDTIAEIRTSLHNDQILVPVSRDGTIEEFQDAGGMGVKVLQAFSKDGMKWQEGKSVAARIALRKGSQASELDRNIVKTVFEAAGYLVAKEGSLDQV